MFASHMRHVFLIKIILFQYNFRNKKGALLQCGNEALKISTLLDLCKKFSSTFQDGRLAEGQSTNSFIEFYQLAKQTLIS